MNTAFRHCYSLAVKGFSPFSGANHALQRQAPISSKKFYCLHLLCSSKSNRSFSMTDCSSAKECSQNQRAFQRFLRKTRLTVRSRFRFMASFLSQNEVFDFALRQWSLQPCLRACFKIPRGAVFGEKAGWQGTTKENILGGSSTEEQRSQAAFCPSTLRAAGLLAVGCVDSVLTAHCGDARTSPSLPHAQNPSPQRLA